MSGPAAAMAATSWRVLFWNGGSLWIGSGGSGQRHSHHAIQLSVALTGRVRLRGSDAGWIEYAAAIVPPHASHQFDAGKESAANIFVEPETVLGRMLLKRYNGTEIIDLSASSLAQFVVPLRDAYRKGTADDQLVAASMQIVQHLSGAAPPLQVDPRITRAIEHVRARLGDTITLAEVAAIAHLSPSRFRHLFVAQTGTSFRAYLLWARVEAAVGAAMTGLSWTEAAHRWGFADSAHLSRTCRRMFGIAPTMLARN